MNRISQKRKQLSGFDKKKINKIKQELSKCGHVLSNDVLRLFLTVDFGFVLCRFRSAGVAVGPVGCSSLDLQCGSRRLSGGTCSKHRLISTLMPNCYCLTLLNMRLRCVFIGKFGLHRFAACLLASRVLIL